MVYSELQGNPQRGLESSKIEAGRSRARAIHLECPLLTTDPSDGEESAAAMDLADGPNPSTVERGLFPVQAVCTII